MEAVAVVHHHIGRAFVDGHALVIDALDFLTAFLGQKGTLFGADVQHDVVDGTVDEHNQAMIAHQAAVLLAQAHPAAGGDDARRGIDKLLQKARFSVAEGLLAKGGVELGGIHARGFGQINVRIQIGDLQLLGHTAPQGAFSAAGHTHQKDMTFHPTVLLCAFRRLA